jgi:hypothetical protein
LKGLGSFFCNIASCFTPNNSFLATEAAKASKSLLSTEMPAASSLTEYNLQNGTLKIRTDNCDFETDEDDIQEIFKECWGELSRYVQVQKELEAELENEN